MEEEKKRIFKAASHFFFPGLLNLSSGGVTFRASLAASCDFLLDVLGYRIAAQCRALPIKALESAGAGRGTCRSAWQSSR